MITTSAFWRGAAERAVKTFLQTFVAVVLGQIGADAIGVSAGILSPDWLTALSVAALAGVLSLATSVGNADFTAGDALPAEPAPKTQVTVVNTPVAPQEDEEP